MDATHINLKRTIISGLVLTALYLAPSAADVSAQDGPLDVDSYQGKPATPETISVLTEAEKKLPIGDFADGSLMKDHAQEKLVARFPDDFIAPGYAAYDYLNGERPASIHPSLFSRARDIFADIGLYELIPGKVYQLRGDLGHTTAVRGTEGWVLLDVGFTKEFAAKSWAFALEHLPGGASVPVTAVIYSHSHTDHFGGSKGVITQEDVDAGKVDVIAPHGFMEEALSENVIAGPAMGRRAQYHFGALLDVKADGTEFVSSGGGLRTPPGQPTLIAPTTVLPVESTTKTVDGVVINFKDVSGAEAPSATILYLPEYKMIFNAELLTRQLHNIYTLRGAKVRDSLMWSKRINEVLLEWGADVEHMTGPHGPTFSGNEKIREYLRTQRDNYGFLHNQAVRLMNSGMKIQDIGQAVDDLVPTALSQVWHTRGYHGTYSHNARAVVNHYIGFYDGNPANLNPLQQKPEAEKLVDYMGGADKILERAQIDFEQGDYRFVATVVNKLVTADPGNWPARHLLADAYEQLGYQSEGPQWRHAYLTAAKELRTGKVLSTDNTLDQSDLVSAATFEDLLDTVAVHVDATKADGIDVAIGFHVKDTGEKYLAELAHSNFSYIALDSLPDTQATLTITRRAFMGLIASRVALKDLLASGAAQLQGDPTALQKVFGTLTADNRSYDLVPMMAAPAAE